MANKQTHLDFRLTSATPHTFPSNYHGFYICLQTRLSCAVRPWLPSQQTLALRFLNHQGLCTASSCTRKSHRCLNRISLNGIHSSAYLAEQGKDYSYLITHRLQAIFCKDLTSKKLLTPLVSRNPEGETVKQDKQSLKYQGLQEDVLNPITYVKVNTWPGSQSQ